MLQIFLLKKINALLIRRSIFTFAFNLVYYKL